MRRVFKKTIVIVLSMLLLLSLLPMTALAEDEPEYPTIEVGETKRLEPVEGGMIYYQFTPEETGWYAIESSEEESKYLYAYLSVLDHGEYCRIQSFGSYGNDHLLMECELEDYLTYRFEFECDGMSGPYSVTLYRPETVMVRFHSGEGTFFDPSTGEATDESVIEVAKGATLNHYPSMSYPENGHLFSGWALNSDAVIPEIQPWNYKVTDNVDLYAIFREPITVTYDCNGGYSNYSGEPSEQFEMTMGVGDWFSYNTAYYPDDAKLFLGWFSERDGGEQYTNDSQMMENTTVYAHWAEPITVTYDANGGTFPDEGGGTTLTRQYMAGDYFTYYHVEHPEPHMHFIGWFTEPEGGEEVGRGDYLVTEEMTVYAHWQKMYMVTLNANGGYFADFAEQSEEMTFGFEREYVTSLPTPTIDDGSSVFEGWYYQKTGGEKFDYSKPLPSEQTLYAHWTPGKQIVFDANGGSFKHNGASTYAKAYLPGSYLSEENYIRFTNMTHSDPKKVFLGWATSKTATKPDITFNQQKVDDYSTLYAVWADGIKITEVAGDGYFYERDPETGDSEKVPTIEFYVPSGTMVGSLSSYYSGITGSSYYVQAYTDQAHKKDFNYRSLTENGAILDYDYVLTGDTMLYVVWKDTAIITFDAGDGYFIDVASVNPPTVKDSEREIGVTRPINYMESFYVKSNDPAKAFIGWSETGNEADIIESITPERDMTLKAVYKTGKLITFQPNIDLPFFGWLKNERFSSYEGNTVIWPDGMSFSETGFSCSVSGSGYILIGLSKTADGSELVEDSWYPIEDMTLYPIMAEGREAYFEAYPGTFPSNGAEWKEVKIPKGKAIGEVETPVLPGKVFAGWASYETDEIVDPKTYVPQREDYLEFYAVWEDGEQKYEWVTPGVNKNYTGIAQEKSGTWYYVKNGEPDFSYTGVKNNDYGWWKIENGIVNFKFNGLAANEYGTWYLKDGKVDFNYTGFAAGTAEGTSGWWYVEKGQVKFNKTDIISGSANTSANKAGVSGWWYVINSKVYTGDTVAKNSNGWWAIRGGKVDFNYTGFAANANGWWYAEKGQVTFKKNDIISGKANTDPKAAGIDGWWMVKNSQVVKVTTVAPNAYGWWRVEDGKVNFEFEGIAENDYGWWYLSEGHVDFNFTGFAENEYGWWYIEKGQITFKKNGLLNGKGRDGWWLVKNSKITDETTVASNDYGWWRVENGQVNFEFNGLADNAYGWWYLEDGKVNFDYTGFAKNENGWWYIEKGQITFKKNDIIYGKANTDPTADIEDGWWLVRSSQVKKETTVASNSAGWWYVKDGRVDFSYNGMAKNTNGLWYIVNGAVDFDHSKILYYDAAGNWKEGYILNTNSGVFHDYSCGHVKEMSAKNKGYMKNSYSELVAKGYRPCNATHER